VGFYRFFLFLSFSDRIPGPSLPGAYPTMRIKLTPALVRGAQADRGSDRTFFWDTQTPGFGLMVTPHGHKSFVLQYRAKGRSRRMAIDGVLTLDAARKRARALLGEVAHDRDPLEQRQIAARRGEDTFRAISEKYFAREGKRLRRSDERQRTLERLVYPTLGNRPIGDIRRSDIVRLLDKIEDNNGAVMADRTLAYVRRVMNWHASRSDDFRSPIVRGMARTSEKERARSRVLTDQEIQTLWQHGDALIKFLLLTGARRSEAAKMPWSEVVDGTWTLPPERNKTKAEFVRPLSRDAQSVLDNQPRVGPFVFTYTGNKPIGSLSHLKARVDAATGLTGWTLHDLRRTARSLMSRAGITPDIAEMCLGHALPPMRRTYDRFSYSGEMRIAFERLAALIEEIAGNGKTI
jgi:integrase